MEEGQDSTDPALFACGNTTTCVPLRHTVCPSVPESHAVPSAGTA